MVPRLCGYEYFCLRQYPQYSPQEKFFPVHFNMSLRRSVLSATEAISDKTVSAFRQDSPIKWEIASLKCARNDMVEEIA